MKWLFCVYTAECGPAQAGREYGSIPASSLLHARLCSSDVSRQSAVPRPHCARAHAADVRRQEHDGCLRSTPWPLPHRRCHLPRSYVHERGTFLFFFLAVTNRWLGSRVVSVLDSGTEGPRSKSQPRRCLRQTVRTRCASVHQAAKLVAALLRVGGG